MASTRQTVLHVCPECGKKNRFQVRDNDHKAWDIGEVGRGCGGLHPNNVVCGYRATLILIDDHWELKQ